MLAEMAIASAAFSTIKQFVQDGKELYEMGDSLAQYFTVKKQIQEKAHKNGYKSDLEAFMAAEQLKAQEDELKQMMIYQGRSGMWDDWLSFQKAQKDKREEEAAKVRKEAQIRKQKLMKSIEIGVAVISTVVIVGGAIWALLYLISLGK